MIETLDDVLNTDYPECQAELHRFAGGALRLERLTDGRFLVGWIAMSRGEDVIEHIAREVRRDYVLHVFHGPEGVEHGSASRLKEIALVRIELPDGTIAGWQVSHPGSRFGDVTAVADTADQALAALSLICPKPLPSDIARQTHRFGS